MSLTFYILDVFAEKKYSGNQLAVFRNARELSDEQMQQIAQEMNYSETTFILSDYERDGGYDVRIFTPDNEVPFAGHPTLGTAWVIREEILKNKVEEIGLNLKVGRIPVTFLQENDGSDVLWMRQNPPVFGQRVDPRRIAGVLSLDLSDLDERFPVQEVSTGLPFIIVPVKSLQAVKKSRVFVEELINLTCNMEAKAIMVFCPETYSPDNQLNARVYVDCYGIPEDPATGSANGCLAGYLAKYQYFGKELINIRVEQGFEMGRPSLLRLRSYVDGDYIRVDVGGKVVLIARGELT